MAKGPSFLRAILLMNRRVARGLLVRPHGVLCIEPLQAVRADVPRAVMCAH